MIIDVLPFGLLNMVLGLLYMSVSIIDVIVDNVECTFYSHRLSKHWTLEPKCINMNEIENVHDWNLRTE